MAVTFECSTLVDDQLWSPYVSLEVPRLVDFDAALAFDVPEYRSEDLDFSCFDVGMDGRLFANDQDVIRGDRSVYFTIDAESAGKLELSRQ